MTQRHKIKARMTQPEMTLKLQKGKGRYQLHFFFLCARSASENHTFSNMPGHIESASQTWSWAELPPPSLGGQVTHCATPLHPGKSPAGQVGCMSHLVMQACVCTWVETHTTMHLQGYSAFVIKDKKKNNKKRTERGGVLLLSLVWEGIKMVYSVALSASVVNNTGKQTSLHHICPKNSSWKDK